MDLDQELHEALRRQPAPPDFAASVLHKIAPAQRPVPLRPVRRRVALAVAAGLAITTLSPWSVNAYRAHRHRERALEARAQLITALEITSEQLRRVREQVNRQERNPQ